MINCNADLVFGQASSLLFVAQKPLFISSQYLLP